MKLRCNICFHEAFWQKPPHVTEWGSSKVSLGCTNIQESCVCRRIHGMSNTSIRKLSRPAKPAKETTAVTPAPIHPHPTPALVSALVEGLHSSQCRSSGTGRCCQIICLSTQPSIFLQNYKHHMKRYGSHYAILIFLRHTITHILENHISSYLVIWFAVSLAVSQRERWSTI